MPVAVFPWMRTPVALKKRRDLPLFVNVLFVMLMFDCLPAVGGAGGDRLPGGRGRGRVDAGLGAADRERLVDVDLLVVRARVDRDDRARRSRVYRGLDRRVGRAAADDMGGEQFAALERFG